jgi:glycosyltransferase involved in cell wall biosynthesis
VAIRPSLPIDRKERAAHLVTGVCSISRKYPLAKFVIAGEGPLREELEDLATELGVRDAVEFRGFLSQADLAKLYADSHVFLHPAK